MRNLHMSEVEISQKQQIDSNDQKPDGKISISHFILGLAEEVAYRRLDSNAHARLAAQSRLKISRVYTFSLTSSRQLS